MMKFIIFFFEIGNWDHQVIVDTQIMILHYLLNLSTDFLLNEGGILYFMALFLRLDIIFHHFKRMNLLIELEVGV